MGGGERMKISKLEVLDNYYRKNRQIGHTTAALNGAKSNRNIILLVASYRQRDCVDLPNEQILSINRLESLKRVVKPILIDHYALQVMFLEMKMDYLKKMNVLIKCIDKFIKYLEREKGYYKYDEKYELYEEIIEKLEKIIM